MPNPPVEYIPFAQTVTPLFKVVQATAIVETRAWHARQTASWAAHTQTGNGPGSQHVYPGPKTPYLAPDASIPEELRGSVLSNKA